MNETEMQAAQMTFDNAQSLYLEGRMDPLDYQDACYAYDVANGHRPR